MDSDTEAHKGSAILLDFENLEIEARKDPGCQLSATEFLDLVVGRVHGIAGRLGPLIRADAALSIPKSGTFDGIENAAEKPSALPIETGKIIQRLTDYGFTSVTIVPRGPDNADWELHKAGLVAMGDSHIQSVVLCTGDGGEPFLKLAKDLLAAGKSVHIVAYDRVAQSMTNLNIPATLLCSVARLASVKPDQEEKTGEVRSISLPIQLTPELLEAEAAAGGVLAYGGAFHKKRISFKPTLKMIIDVRADKKSDTYRKIVSAIWAFNLRLPTHIARDRQLHGANAVGLHYLIDFLSENMKGQLAEGEARDISLALCTLGGLFQKLELYQLNTSCKLLKITKPI